MFLKGDVIFDERECDDRSGIGRYELPWLEDSPGFGMGIIFPCFHISGISRDCRHMLKVLLNNLCRVLRGA